MKRKLIILAAGIVFILAFNMPYVNRHSYHLSPLSNPNAPNSYTGAPNASTGTIRTCATNGGCHSDNALNTIGGSVEITGLPANYVAGTTYPISIVITHAASDRAIWGFAIKAVNGTATNTNWLAGSWTTANANAGTSGTAGTTVSTQTLELRSTNAPVTVPAKNTYTFTNINWVAPPVATAPATVKFYVVGNAGDGFGDDFGDFIYSGSYTVPLQVIPVVLSSFTATVTATKSVQLQWQTEQEQNSSYFELESSTNNTNWQIAGKLNAAGNSSTARAYSFTDNKPSAYNIPLFYRLKMVDRDGSFRYSEIKPVVVKNTGVIVYSRNVQPVFNTAGLKYELHAAESFTLRIRVLDEVGNILYTGIRQINTGSNDITVKLPPGRGMNLVNVELKGSNGFSKIFREIVQ